MSFGLSLAKSQCVRWLCVSGLNGELLGSVCHLVYLSLYSSLESMCALVVCCVGCVQLESFELLHAVIHWTLKHWHFNSFFCVHFHTSLSSSLRFVLMFQCFLFHHKM